MLSSFRSRLNTWPARLFFIALASAFGLWGIGDVVRNVGNDGAAIHVAGRGIELSAVQQAYRQRLAAVTKRYGEPPPELRRTLAEQAASGVAAQAALDETIRRMGIVVPDEQLNQRLSEQREFRGADGKFDAERAREVLRSSKIGQNEFVDETRAGLARQQLLEAVAAGAAAPEALTRTLFALQTEQRTAETVEFPIDAMVGQIGEATEAQLRRWWVNHPERYSTPEYRKIKLVVLSAETVAAEVRPSPEELDAAWAQHADQFRNPERRSIDMLLAADEATARKLADQWIAGASWPAMQDAANAVAATASEQRDLTRAELPTGLAAAVFASPAETVGSPVHSALGWHVFRVVTIAPAGAQTRAQAQAALSAWVTAERATDLVNDRTGKVEDSLAGGTPLDQLGEFGLTSVVIMADRAGLTPEGGAAPIPGPTAIRVPLLQAAFGAKPGDPPKLIQGPPAASTAYYAFSVEDIRAPAQRPYEQVVEAVRADWARDQARALQDAAATRLMVAVRDGGKLAELAAAAGRQVREAAPAERDPEGSSRALPNVLFGMKTGEATMVDTPNGYIVAVVTKVQSTDPKADPITYRELREQTASSAGKDSLILVQEALFKREKPRLDLKQIDGLAE